MGDDSVYLTRENIEVAVDGLREEAKKWYGFADEISKIHTTVKNIEIMPSAFSVATLSGADPSGRLYNDYSNFHTRVSSLTGQAARAFEVFGDALKRMADNYEQNEGITKKSFDEIATNR